MAEAEVKAVKLEGRERQKWALAAPDSAWVERHRRDCSDQGSFSSDRGGYRRGALRQCEYTGTSEG